MGFSNGCKIHPYQEQKQGVCPSCLRERLSRLCSTSFNDASRVTPYSSNSSSPARRRNSHRGLTGIVRSSSSVVKVGGNYGLNKSASIALVPEKVGGNYGLNKSASIALVPRKVGGNYGLNKSRSIAFVPRKVGDEDVQNGDKKKMKGFWSKLLRLKGKKKDVMHTSSMRFL